MSQMYAHEIRFHAYLLTHYTNFVVDKTVSINGLNPASLTHQPRFTVVKITGDLMIFGAQRINDMMCAYNRIIAEVEFISMNEVYKRIANEPAPRFYVSPERAACVVACVLAGGCIDDMRQRKREMYLEITQRAKMLGAVHGMKMLKLRDICAMVVKQEAPKFYMSPGSIKVMICKNKRKWYNEQLKKRLRFL